MVEVSRRLLLSNLHWLFFKFCRRTHNWVLGDVILIHITCWIIIFRFVQNLLSRLPYIFIRLRWWKDKIFITVILIFFYLFDINFNVAFHLMLIIGLKLVNITPAWIFTRQNFGRCTTARLYFAVFINDITFRDGLHRFTCLVQSRNKWNLIIVEYIWGTLFQILILQNISLRWIEWFQGPVLCLL